MPGLQFFTDQPVQALELHPVAAQHQLAPQQPLKDPVPPLYLPQRIPEGVAVQVFGLLRRLHAAGDHPHLVQRVLVQIPLPLRQQ